MKMISLVVVLLSCYFAAQVSSFSVAPQRRNAHLSYSCAARRPTCLPADMRKGRPNINVWSLPSIARRLRTFFSHKTKGKTSVIPKQLNPEEETESQAMFVATPDSLTPAGPRWAISAQDVNLTGLWQPIITPAFKQEYDTYLKGCGQNVIFRSLCNSVVSFVKEDIQHDGTSLTIAGTTPVGEWKRELISSGTNLTHDSFHPISVTIVDPDGDTVSVESWWQDDGRTHVSWLRDKPRVKGGVFESRRYLTPENKLVCESTFHPAKEAQSQIQVSTVKWTFNRVV